MLLNGFGMFLTLDLTLETTREDRYLRIQVEERAFDLIKAKSAVSVVIAAAAMAIHEVDDSEHHISPQPFSPRLEQLCSNTCSKVLPEYLVSQMIVIHGPFGAHSGSIPGQFSIHSGF